MAERKCSNCAGTILGRVDLDEDQYVSIGFFKSETMHFYVCFDCGEIGAYIDDKLEELRKKCIRTNRMVNR